MSKKSRVADVCEMFKETFLNLQANGMSFLHRFFQVLVTFVSYFLKLVTLHRGQNYQLWLVLLQARLVIAEHYHISARLMRNIIGGHNRVVFGDIFTFQSLTITGEAN